MTVHPARLRCKSLKNDDFTAFPNPARPAPQRLKACIYFFLNPEAKHHLIRLPRNNGPRRNNEQQRFLIGLSS
jgi:hypothetical protein